MRFLRIIAALWLALAPLQAWAGSMTLLGAGSVASAPTYQGPVDIVSSGAFGFWSCARAADAALASTSTSLCDLVDSSTGAAVGTLRASASGFVDLSAYFSGGVTPAAACAAASGGLCRVSKIYDQVGTNPFASGTNSQRPTLTFAALNGLPGITCSSAGVSILTSSVAVSVSSPLSWETVYERTANPTNSVAILAATPSVATIGPSSVANEALVNNGTALPTGATVADNAFHALQAVASGPTVSAITADAQVATTGNAGSTGLVSSTFRFCRTAASLDGIVMEVGLWGATAFTVGAGNQTGNLNANAHGSNGYNF